MRGRRREVIATVGACVALSLLALAVVGPAPFRAFFGYQLPRIASGEAFSFFQRGWLYISRNIAISAILFKLRELGAPGGVTRAASAVGWIYTIIVIGLTVWAARQEKDRLGEVSTWLGLLVLASLRSPMAPVVYIVTPVLWMLALRPMRGARGVVAMIVGFIVVMGPPPLPVAAVELVTLMIIQGVVVFIAVRGGVRPPAAA